MQVKEVIKKAVLIVLSAFVCFNLIVFGFPIIREAFGTPYFKPRIYMVSSRALTSVYIIPIAGIFKEKKAPFGFLYRVRDYLYRKGDKAFPENEGERALWWVRIYGNEYNRVYSPEIEKVHENKILFSDSEAELYLSRVGRIFVFLDNYYADMGKKEFLDAKQELALYEGLSGLMSLYYQDSSWIKFFLNGTQKNHQILSEDEILKTERLLELYLRISEKFQNKFSEEYKRSKTHYFEYGFLHNAFSDVLTYKISSQTFSCAYPKIKTYLSNRENLISSVVKGHNVSPVEARLFVDTVEPNKDVGVFETINKKCHHVLTELKFAYSMDIYVGYLKKRIGNTLWKEYKNRLKSSKISLIINRNGELSNVLVKPSIGSSIIMDKEKIAKEIEEMSPFIPLPYDSKLNNFQLNIVFK